MSNRDQELLEDHGSDGYGDGGHGGNAVFSLQSSLERRNHPAAEC